MLPRSSLGTLAVRRVRRSRQNAAAVSDADTSKNEIELPIHRSRATYMDPDGVDNNVVDATDPDADTIALFNLGVIKATYQDGDDYQEVGRRKIALLNANAVMISAIPMQISWSLAATPIQQRVSSNLQY